MCTLWLICFSLFLGLQGVGGGLSRAILSLLTVWSSPRSSLKSICAFQKISYRRFCGWPSMSGQLVQSFSIESICSLDLCVGIIKFETGVSNYWLSWSQTYKQIDLHLLWKHVRKSKHEVREGRWRARCGVVWCGVVLCCCCQWTCYLIVVQVVNWSPTVSAIIGFIHHLLCRQKTCHLVLVKLVRLSAVCGQSMICSTTGGAKWITYLWSTSECIKYLWTLLS